MEKPVVSVVMGTYNRRKFLSATLNSIRDNGYTGNMEIIVIDGGSTDGTLNYLRKQTDIITIIQQNHGSKKKPLKEKRSWGQFMNLGFKISQGKYILMLSDDCLLVPLAIKNGVEYFEYRNEASKNVGGVAFYWRNWPEEINYNVRLTLGNKMIVNHGLFLREALEEINWINEDDYQFYHADSDLCLRLWAKGYLILDCKNSFVEHFNHLKPSTNRYLKDWEVHKKRWSGIYYDQSKDNRGGKIYLSHKDNFHTYKNFPSLQIIKYYLKRLKKKVTKSINT